MIRIAGFAIPFCTVFWLILRRLDRKRYHRSIAQWCIVLVYAVVRLLYALNRAFDVGYLEYRRVLDEPPPVVENERCLGKLVGQQTP